MKILGITGGIGSGKSEAARLLKEAFHVPVIDADQLARKAVEKGTRGYQAVVQHFGEGILDEKGELDRKALGAMIFDDLEKRRALNAIVHPQVEALYYEKVEEEKKRGTRWLIYDCPLLIEENLLYQVDQVWLIRATLESRVSRITTRSGLSPEQALQRIQAQMPDEEKERYAHVVVWNDGTLEELGRILVKLWENSFKILLSIE